MSLATVSVVSCVFSILFFKSLEHLYYHHSEFSFRQIAYFLFIWCCEFLLCSFIFTLYFSVLLFFPNVCSDWGLLSAFRDVYLLLLVLSLEERLVLVVCVDFLLGVTCACILVEKRGGWPPCPSGKGGIFWSACGTPVCWLFFWFFLACCFDKVCPGWMLSTAGWY